MPVSLDKRQIRYLRSIAQTTRPRLHLGHGGRTEQTQRALEELLTHHELVKVRILPSAGLAARDVADTMAGESSAAVVGVVGNTFVLYRPNPELKQPIQFPD